MSAEPHEAEADRAQVTETDAAVLEFIRAFNEQDFDRLAAVLHPEVELRAGRGLRRGIEQARAWAARSPGGLQQTIVFEKIRAGSSGSEAFMLALIIRAWHWDEDGSSAGSERMAWAFEISGGRIRSWRPFDSPEHALGLLATEPVRLRASSDER